MTDDSSSRLRLWHMHGSHQKASVDFHHSRLVVQSASMWSFDSCFWCMHGHLWTRVKMRSRSQSVNTAGCQQPWPIVRQYLYACCAAIWYGGGGCGGACIAETQCLQIRTAFVKPSCGKGARCREQSSQHEEPHMRQWCLRFNRPNLVAQWEHSERFCHTGGVACCFCAARTTTVLLGVACCFGAACTTTVLLGAACTTTVLRVGSRGCLTTTTGDSSTTTTRRPQQREQRHPTAQAIAAPARAPATTAPPNPLPHLPLPPNPLPPNPFGMIDCEISEHKQL